MEPGSELQAALYHVTDHEDQIVPGVGLFNCCTHCGLAFGGKLWWNRDLGTAHAPEALSHLEITLDAFQRKTSKIKAGQY